MDQDDEAFFRYLTDQCCYRDARSLGDGTYACIYPLLLTHAIIVGRIGDLSGCEDRWCYHSYVAAKAALDTWDGEGEPLRWHRHPSTGRRRREGNASAEISSNFRELQSLLTHYMPQ